MIYAKDTSCAEPVLQTLAPGSFPNIISPAFTAWRETVAASRWARSLRDFSAEVRGYDPLLYRLGWIQQALIPMFAVMALLSAGHGVSPWIKPMQFATSFSTFLWTFAPMLQAMRVPEWQKTAARQATAAGVVFEMLFLSAQAWRSSFATGPATITDTIIFQGTSVMISVITTVMLWLTVLYFTRRATADIDNRSMLIAVRFGLVIFMAGNAIGGYMLARGSHTVGAADGGPGLPFTNWSTIAGDLRIAHFIAIHAIQILPLLAWLISELRPSFRLNRRRILFSAASCMLFIASMGTFVQASRGRPLVGLFGTQQMAKK